MCRHGICITVLFAGFVLYLYLLLSIALAQANTSGTPTADNPQRNITDVKEHNLRLQKLDKEVQKLTAEITTMNAVGPQTRWFSTIAGAIGGSIGAVLTFVLGVIGWRFNRGQRQRLKQEEILTREKHNLELFQNLGHEDSRVQIAAATVLIQRLDALRQKEQEHVRVSLAERQERPTIIRVLIAVTKEKARDADKEGQRALVKHIADNLVQAIGAIIPETQDGEPPVLKPRSLLADFDWQGARLTNAWWRRVDARKIDFFEADFSDAGLAEAFLNKAVFYNANLCNAVLRGADLSGANMCGADLRGTNLIGAGLEGTKLEGATYDVNTKWTDGFDPNAAGARLKTLSHTTH
ncbi:MAG: pentapeptide repeat-containing protein [Gammaproteobacteria bacterium]|nr:pentapeptide repeat-containing protein [Gammaproteobacteria bacterium]